MSFALALCLLTAPPVVEEQFDFAVVMTHTFQRGEDTFTVSHLILRRGKGHYIGKCNVEPGELEWNPEPGGLVCRYFDPLDECHRIVHVKSMREVTLPHEFDARGIPWLDMKKP